MPRITTSLRSEALSRMDYDPDTQTLTVTFRGGRAYAYQRVPPDVAEQLSSAESPGTFWRNNIKDQYG